MSSVMIEVRRDVYMDEDRGSALADFAGIQRVIMTHHYYEQQADAYFEATVHADLADLYAPFLAALPTGAHVLDAGCGSGRDSLAFLRRGHRVTAFDASAALVARAAAWVDQAGVDTRRFEISTRAFQQVEERAVYDGIWACASLLHVAADAVPDCLARLWQALKPGGVFYCSFKHGRGERTDEHGRHFTDADEALLTTWFATLTERGETRFWSSMDHSGRGVLWANLLVRKQAAPHHRLTTGGSHPFLPKLCRAINHAGQIDIAVAFVKITVVAIERQDRGGDDQYLLREVV